MSARRGVVIVLAAVLALAPGLAAAAAVGAKATDGAHVRVFAAASLATSFGELGRAFEKTHAGAHVELVLAGSQQLVAQLRQGASGDVLATADMRTMEDAKAANLLQGDAATFVRNRLVLIVPASNPARIRSWADLSKRGVKLVIGTDAVPVGHYAREVLVRLAKQPGGSDAWLTHTNANVVSEEENVKAVLSKVQLGEADAGFVYRSDIAPAVARYVRIVPFPDDANVIASYPIAALAQAPYAELARAFADYVTTPAAQAVFVRNGFLPATATP
jgi:molybdate transport system substrate-binding protein